jgi:hypothetical protein
VSDAHSPQQATCAGGALISALSGRDPSGQIVGVVGWVKEMSLDSAVKSKLIERNSVAISLCSSGFLLPEMPVSGGAVLR